MNWLSFSDAAYYYRVWGSGLQEVDSLSLPPSLPSLSLIFLALCSSFKEQFFVRNGCIYNTCPSLSSCDLTVSHSSRYEKNTWRYNRLNKYLFLVPRSFWQPSLSLLLAHAHIHIFGCSLLPCYWKLSYAMVVSTIFECPALILLPYSL